MKLLLQTAVTSQEFDTNDAQNTPMINLQTSTEIVPPVNIIGNLISAKAVPVIYFSTGNTLLLESILQGCLVSLDMKTPY